MNIVLGVDGCEASGTPSPASFLLQRLRFPKAKIDVVNVLTPLQYGDWGMGVVLMADAFDAAESAAREWAEDMVHETAEQLRKSPSAHPQEIDPDLVNTFVPHAASASEGLLEHAEQMHADLIVVDGPHSGPLGAFLTGSAARSLVIDSHEHSLLLAKDSHRIRVAAHGTPTPKDAETTGLSVLIGTTPPASPIRAVFATDHSPYADRCLEKLLRFLPLGISHLMVLTAYPEEKLAEIGRFLPNLAVHPMTAVREALAVRNSETLKKLAPLLAADGATGESRITGAPVNEAIAQAMEETKADLLIVGARGHGFIDRLTLGSVSFHQAMTAPYSVLILRA